MFRNYVATALRNFLKDRLYTLINVVGLAIGMMACFLISLFVLDELSFDRFWQDGSRVYRLHTSLHAPGRDPSVSVQAPGPTKHLLDQYFTDEISASARIVDMETVVSARGIVSKETIHWTDPGMAGIFSLDLVVGDLAATLGDRSSLAISEAFALRQFGTTDVVGEVLTLSVRQLNGDYRVGAVFKDLPHNTVLAFEALASIHEEDFPGRFDGWTSMAGHLFIKLERDASITDITSRLPGLLDRNIPLTGTGYPDAKASEFIRHQAMALKDLHLSAVGWGEMKITGDMETVVIMATLAVVVLAIAGVNFANLSTARATKRAKEVALRKVVGARRAQLVTQFLGESLLLSLMALVIGLVMVDVFLPFYEEFIGRDLSIHYGVLPVFAALLTAALVGLLGGAYPALVLSGYLPGKILKTGRPGNAPGVAGLRYFLVICQFSASIILIVATVVVYGQLSLTASVDRGFNSDNLLILGGTRSQGIRNQQKILKDQILALPEVVNASYSWRVPGRGGGTAVVERSGDGAASPINVNIVGRGYDFLDTYETNLLAGREYDPSFANDGIPSGGDGVAGEILSGTIMINESAARRFGFSSPDQAIGNAVQMVLRDTEAGQVKADLEIIGVSADMHFYSLRDVVAPEVHELVRQGAPYLSLRYRGDLENLLPQLEKIWQQVAPNVPFEAIYVDDLLEADIVTVRDFGTVMAGFSLLAIFVACLGLYGLASAATEQRVREIAVRKVLGASVVDIVRLLVWQFSRPVMGAILVAWPIATWAMLSWLERFAYRIDEWFLLPLGLACGFAALLVAWLTTGGNAVQAARANPINALRYE